MKTALHLLLTLSLMLCTWSSQAANTALGSLPKIVTIKGTDYLIVNMTNTGLGTTSDRIIAIADLVNSPSLSSNRHMTDFHLMPTNIYSNASWTISGTSGSHLLTANTAAAFSGVQPGYNFAQGTAQWTVCKIIDSTHVLVYEPLGSTLVNSPFVIYPNAATFHDIDGNPFGSIGNDASIGVIGLSDFAGNSGCFYWFDGTNTVRVSVRDQTQGPRWEVAPLPGGGAAPFAVAIFAPEDSLEVYPDGTVSHKYGLTNRFGDLVLWGPVSVPQRLKLGGGLGVATTNAVTTGLTLSGTANSGTFTASGSIFNSVGPGWKLQTTGGGQWTITQVVNGTTVRAFPQSASTFTDTFAIYPPALVVSNSGGAFAGAITSDGMFLSDNSTSVGGTLLEEGTNGFRVRINDEGDGPRYEIYTSRNQVPFSVSIYAPFDAVEVQSNGTFSVQQGLTNNTGGPLKLRGTVQAPEGATITGLAVTGDSTNTSGDVIVATAGKGLKIKGGANSRVGTNTFSSGSCVVANTSITANTIVIPQFIAESGYVFNTPGSLVVSNTPGVGFTIFSANNLETNRFKWVAIEGF